MILFSVTNILIPLIIIGIILGLALWLIGSKKKSADLPQIGRTQGSAPTKLIDADFVEFEVSESDMNILESKVNELGAVFLSEKVYQGKMINFSGINLKINRLEPANANKITAKTEISIVPADEVVSAPSEPGQTLRVSKPETRPNVPDYAPKKKILMNLTAVISLILVLISLFYVVSGFLKSDFIKQTGIFGAGKKQKAEVYKKSGEEKNISSRQVSDLTDREIAILMYPGIFVSDFTISDTSQENIKQYAGLPGFYIKTKSYNDCFTGNPQNMNTIVIAAKEYADLTGDGVEELIVVSIGDGEILPDCMANLSANNVIVYKWNGSNYEELWRANMDLGQEGKFDKLEIISKDDNIPVIQLFGKRFTHGDGASFIDSYKWNGVTFGPLREQSKL